MSKPSRFKKHQLIMENWRRYVEESNTLNEGVMDWAKRKLGGRGNTPEYQASHQALTKIKHMLQGKIEASPEQMQSYVNGLVQKAGGEEGLEPEAAQIVQAFLQDPGSVSLEVLQSWDGWDA